MTKKYKILGKYIKDMSSETPDIETYIFVRDCISKYQLFSRHFARKRSKKRRPIGRPRLLKKIPEWLPTYNKETMYDMSQKQLEHLKKLGYQTFSNYWNEDYDNEENPEIKVSMITDVIKELQNKSIEELHEMYWDMMPILKHNQSLLINQ